MKIGTRIKESLIYLGLIACFSYIGHDLYRLYVVNVPPVEQNACVLVVQPYYGVVKLKVIINSEGYSYGLAKIQNEDVGVIQLTYTYEELRNLNPASVECQN